MKKTCTCGKDFEGDAWEELPLHGYTSDQADQVALEYRTCDTCHSTMCLEVRPYDGRGVIVEVRKPCLKLLHKEYTIRNAIHTALHELLDGATEAWIDERKWQ